MNNLSSYCGLDDARISASGKDLPVNTKRLIYDFCHQLHIMICSGKYISIIFCCLFTAGTVEKIKTNIQYST